MLACMTGKLPSDERKHPDVSFNAVFSTSVLVDALKSKANDALYFKGWRVSCEYIIDFILNLLSAPRYLVHFDSWGNVVPAVVIVNRVLEYIVIHSAKSSHAYCVPPPLKNELFYTQVLLRNF